MCANPIGVANMLNNDGKLKVGANRWLNFDAPKNEAGFGWSELSGANNVVIETLLDRRENDMKNYIAAITDGAANKTAKEIGLLNSNNESMLNDYATYLEQGFNRALEIMADYQGLTNFALKAELTKTGLAQKAINPAMYSVLEQVALQGAVYEDGVVKFVNADGSTQYHNGKALTLSDRVEQLNGTPEYAPLFVPQGKGGTGGKGGGESVVDFGKMSATEMMNSGRK